MNLSWKRAMRPRVADRRKGTRIKTFMSIGFSVFALLIGSVGLAGCDVAGEAEQEGVELEESEKPETEEE